MYKIRYLKVKEEFEIVVPDPLDKSGKEEITVRISDYDMFLILRGIKVKDLDDDTRLGIEKLRETHVLSVKVLKDAKTKQHLRRLNRVDTSWVELKSKKRKSRSRKKDPEIIEYLSENYDKIVANCVKHDWYTEFSLLCKDLGIKDAKTRWRELKKEEMK